MSNFIQFIRTNHLFQEGASGRAMDALPAVAPAEQDFLSTLPPDRAQKRLALAVVLAFLSLFIVTFGPLWDLQPGRLNAFGTAYATAMFTINLITAVILFAQFSVLRMRALLVIASGYLYTSLMIIPWALTFPGLIRPGGVIGGLQSTSWIYVLWHAGFPCFVIAYALLKGADPGRRLWRGSAVAAIVSSIAATAAVVGAAAFLLTMEEVQLPHLMLDTVHRDTLWFYTAGCTALVSLIALLVLAVRQGSVLDLWLMVVMCAHVLEMIFNSWPPAHRFSMGWYASRVCSLLAANLVLFVLLYEVTKLYAQLHRTAHARAALVAALDAKNQALEAANAVLAQRSQELARTNAELEQIVHVASHDLQEPLRMVASYVQLLEQRYGGRLEADAHEFIGFAVEGARRMQALINDLLAYSRVGTQAQPLQPTDCTAVVATALRMLRPAIEESGAHIQYAGLPMVMGDATQLAQLFQNLLANAIKFRGEQAPRIVVWAEPDHGCWRLAVQDNGIGIAPEYYEQIFVMFQRLHSRSAYPGNGIGLAICKKIVERHGGRIWVEAAQQQGSVFKFTLPQASDTGQGRSLSSPG